MRIKEIIVVEGKSDTTKIKLAVDADTIETNGSAINDETLALIAHAKEKRGVIIFTDPDYPGERIRHIIDQAVPGCKHAFLQREEAKAKSSIKSIGIEHASIPAIQKALRHVYELEDTVESSVTKADLIRYGLVGGSGAKERREQLGKLLHIGYTNGKQLLYRLHMFHIQKEELDEAMKRILL
ncbi:MAG TPA: ribonuclease M5 [Candidatus Pseudogracilibacillus intestinigallinarum]|uniref:Ribonuclease M5 n=1 Tax=Candidatus Pseudogracilibacillus intestinigallinarum TaxID=2838742 RepID=A0A9D1PL03_9BACI|nr:ribonuclease M5 [Candidatus Pseudogracilibacillus intestinigallinarum]